VCLHEPFVFNIDNLRRLQGANGPPFVFRAEGLNQGRMFLVLLFPHEPILHKTQKAVKQESSNVK
jgi:hypothetical protein